MNLIKQDAYIIESIDTSPENSWRGFVITRKDDGATLEKKASFYTKNGWIIDNNWEGEFVTHWLKPIKQVYILTEKELDAEIQDAFTNGQRSMLAGLIPKIN